MDHKMPSSSLRLYFLTGLKRSLNAAAKAKIASLRQEMRATGQRVPAAV
jgi:hypothetical protein